MTDLMDVLYSYAQDHEIAVLLAQDDGYNESLRCVKRWEGRVRAELGGSAASLEDLLEEQRLSQFYKEEICFRAGFQMALELTR